MKACSLLHIAAALLSFSVINNAQSDTMHHRVVYDQINEKEASLKKGRAAPKAATKIAEGTFVRIEEGDYFHWNMKSNSGEELSFFIMKPDASVDKVIDNPKAYVGKKCRVTWKKSTENLPEAGGKMEIDQILSVEWLGKK